jgi:HTH-type transcriptional regulator / antitoxin HigA
MYISKDSRLECSTEQDYARLIELLDGLIDQVGEDETHPLASMMDLIGVLIENYETEHIPELDEVA